MKVYRSILLDENENVNTDNLGCSWTLCSVFAENHAKDINRAVGKGGFLILEAEINSDSIDFDNTLFAMENRDYEYEVVLTGQVSASVYGVFGIDFDDSQVFEGEAGDNNFEDYCETYEGDLTQEDFLALASDF